MPLVGQELAYLSGTPEFTPVLQWGSCAQFLVFHVMFCGRVIVLPTLLLSTAVNYPSSKFSYFKVYNICTYIIGKIRH